MAKVIEIPKFVVGVDVDLDWSAIHWFNNRNSRGTIGKPWSDFESATRSLDPDKGETDADRTGTSEGCVIPLLHGWDVNHGVVKFTVPTKEEIAEAIGERKARLDFWRQDDDTKTLAAFVEPIWFPKGEPTPILAIGNMCYRRGATLPYVTLARKMRGIDPTGHYAVRCMLASYTDNRAKYKDHLAENLGKDFGRVKYKALDYVKIAATLAEFPGARESDLLDVGCKRGEAQRCWRFVQLARDHRDLNLIERVNMPAPDMIDGKIPYTPGGFLDIRKFDKEKLYLVINGKNPFDKEKNMSNSSKNIEEKYLRVIMEGSRKSTAITKADLDFWSGCKLQIAAYIMQAVKLDRKDMLEALLPLTDKINTALKSVVDFEAIKDGLSDEESAD